MAEEWVEIVHSTHGSDVEPGVVTQEAFDEVHKAKGWKVVGRVVGPDEVEAPAAHAKGGAQHG